MRRGWRVLTAMLVLGAAAPSVAQVRTPPVPAVPLFAVGTTTRASVSSAGGQAVHEDDALLAGAARPAVSADGRYVAFFATVEGLVKTPHCPSWYADKPSGGQVYLRDRKTGSTELVSVLPGNCMDPNIQTPYGVDQLSVSADGRCVAFTFGGLIPKYDRDGGTQVYVRDRKLRRTILVSLGVNGHAHNNYASDPVVSADCRYVAFTSAATNAVAGTAKEHGGPYDAYVRDLRTGRTESIGAHVRDKGWSKFLMSMTPDGRYVTFVTAAPQLWQGNPKNIVPTTYLSGSDQVYVYDRRTRTTEMVSYTFDGHAANNAVVAESGTPNISADGRYVVFSTVSTDMSQDDVPVSTFPQDPTVDVYLRDRETRKTIRVTSGPGGQPGDWASVQPTISADGRWIAFTSGDTNLGDVDLTPWASGVWPDTHTYNKDQAWGYDVYLYDRLTGTHRIVSRATDGTQANDMSMQPSLSADGRVIAYSSRATNLVPGDTNDMWDVFVTERRP